LSLESIIILDNLARVAKTNRSRLLDDLLKAKGMKELGLSALEEHASSIQKWKPAGKRDDPGACNPHMVGGRCKHTHCSQLYRRWGV